jgi:dephospho-CoA kinase
VLRILGLTGGIGAGKSAAAGRFLEQGVPVLDADRIGHETLMPGGLAEAAVREEFGEGILTNGRIDRDKLARLVFGTPERLQALNAMVHPAVRETLSERVARLADDGHRVVLIEAALHGEDGQLREPLQGLVLVMASEETRLRRLMETRGMEETEAQRRIEAQMDPAQKLHLADWVIHNDRDLIHLHRQVDTIAQELLQ